MRIFLGRFLPKEKRMLRMILNEKGNLAVALVLAVVGLMSGFTMANLAMRDVVGFNYDYEGIQGLHLLRTEGIRGQAIIQKSGFSGSEMYLPPRSVAVVGSHLRRTFKLRSRVTQDMVSVAQGGFRTGGYTVRTLAIPSRGTGLMTIGNRNDSIVRKYGEFSLRRRSFSEFHYFTDNEESTNGTPVYFWGPDEITGRVHSNTDIWIKQAGGGNNNGWPLFHNLVTTAGVIQSIPGTFPEETVFPGGFLENYHTYEYPPLANNVRNNGHLLGQPDDPNRIFIIDVDMSSYSGMMGIISERRVFADVYSFYPPPTGTALFRNSFVTRDTTWSPIPGGSNTRSIFVHNKLWLSGNFQGRQTYGCADTLYLKGDITLQGTLPGSAPDNPTNMNKTDIVGIVSEKSILIQYGYRDPIDSLRKHPNCGPDSDGIFIYAALCALGSDEQSHYDGVFSYQYQKPHPSTPSYWLNNVLYTWIDIHRRRFPQQGGVRWPTLPAGSTVTPRAGLDLPFYNPLWPERQPYNERGTIHLWGSVAQRRRGFVHRSAYDTEYPPGGNSSGIWNVPLDLTGPTITQNWTEPIVQGGPGVQFNTRNFPGATGSGSGYKKNYHFDNRFLYVSPNDFPDVNLKGGSTPLQAENWTLRRPPTNL